MARIHWLLSFTCLAAPTAALVGCHVPGCREGDQTCAMATTGTGGNSTGDDTAAITTAITPAITTGAPTSGTETGESTGDVTATEPDTGGPGVCGDGVHDDGEECDDGNDALDDACRRAVSSPAAATATFTSVRRSATTPTTTTPMRAPATARWRAAAMVTCTHRRPATPARPTAT